MNSGPLPYKAYPLTQFEQVGRQAKGAREVFGGNVRVFTRLPVRAGAG